MSALLAPVTPPSIASTSGSATIVTPCRPTGPAKPTGAPVASTTVSGVGGLDDAGAERSDELHLVDLSVAAYEDGDSLFIGSDRSES